MGTRQTRAERPQLRIKQLKVGLPTFVIGDTGSGRVKDTVGHPVGKLEAFTPTATSLTRRPLSVCE